MIVYTPTDSYGTQATASGIGRDSETLSKIIMETSADFLFPSVSTSAWVDALTAIFLDLPRRCSERDWDGEDSEPLSESSRIAAQTALTLLLKAGAPAPDVMVDPDGEVALEWATPGKSVIFTLQTDGTLGHTALYDGVQEKPGTIAFNDVLPTALLDKIRKVYR